MTTEYFNPSICDTHPLEILAFLRRCKVDNKEAALCCVTEIEGGGVRELGALFAVSCDGEMAGYVSNGCIDADIAVQAQRAIIEGGVKKIRYGAKSPYKDIRLPCGGSVEVMITPFLDLHFLETIIETLEARRSGTLSITLSGEIFFDHHMRCVGWSKDRFYIPLFPKLCIHIAGQGAELIALSNISHASGYEVILETPDAQCQAYARHNSFNLYLLAELDNLADKRPYDPWTAFVSLFHDHDWEAALLRNALLSHAFYIGAMGSRRTHLARCKCLEEQGVSTQLISKIHAPIGLIPTRRDASSLAISIIAEIVSVWGKHIEDMRRGL